MHWEWRGFGDLSDGFLEGFERLAFARDWQEVTDTYFLLPTSDLNLKCRDGAEDGLKLKRRLRRSGELELWTERLEDMRAFPLSDLELASLARGAGLRLPPLAERVLDRDAAVEALSRAQPRPGVVRVRKVRETHRLWEGARGVLVELAEITSPVRTRSLCVQSACDLEEQGPAEVRAAEELVRRALEALAVSREALRPSSYADAVRAWASPRER
jgi:hypothetical protein